jgi:hypothetical protein
MNRGLHHVEKLIGINLLNVTVSQYEYNQMY